MELSLFPEKKTNWLSHTALEQLNRCPKCFWLSYKKKIKLPEGIQSRLANRFDIVLKQYFNHYRRQNVLPPIIDKKLPGKLESPFKEKYFLRITDHYGFYGKLDECLVVDNKYIPIDFKTASSDPRDKGILDAYRHQIDEYIFLMENNQRQTAGYGYLIFFFPDLSDTIHHGFPMVMHIEKVVAHPEKVSARIKKAIKVLDGAIPSPSEGCPYCNWFEAVKDYY